MSRLAATAAAIAVLCASGAKAQTQNTVLLNTLGYATGQSVLLTHMAVGTLADAYVGKAYGQSQATNVVDTYINMTTGLQNQLRSLLTQHTLVPSDSTFIENTIGVLDLVLQETNDLKNYVSSGANSDALAYDSSRKKALAEIKTLLSIKD